jgi:hypothetical protein
MPNILFKHGQMFLYYGASSFVRMNVGIKSGQPKSFSLIKLVLTAAFGSSHNIELACAVTVEHDTPVVKPHRAVYRILILMLDEQVPVT